LLSLVDRLCRRPWLAALLANVALGWTAAARAQVFTNVTASAGINHNAVRPNCPTCAPTFAQ
jgi:hypothetical protein